MTTFFGTNLVTVPSTAITTGQATTGSDSSDNSVHLTAVTGPLTHGVFMVVDAGNFYVTIDDGSGTYDDDSDLSGLGVKVSGNNPIFIPISNPSKIAFCSTASSKTMTFICY